MENLSVCFVPRLTLVERPSTRPSRSCAVGAVCARGAQFSFCLQFPVVSSVSVTVQWTCCATHMTRTPQWLKKNALVIPAQFISLRMVAEHGLLF